MAQHHQSHHQDLIAPGDHTIPPQILQLINSTRTLRPAELIKQVHEGALEQYHRTKKEKQKELASRVFEASRSGDKIAFKNAKKKVDNHASSVASRSRRTFLISSFENVVGRSLQEKNELAEELLRQNVAVAKKDVELRRAHMKIAKLIKENQSLKAHLTRPNTKSPALPTRGDTWNPIALSIDTIGQRSTDPSASVGPSIDQFGELHSSHMGLGEIDEDGTETGYLDIATHGPVDVSQNVDDNLKMDVSTEWGTLTPINPSVQARMKADTPDDVFFPAV